MMKILDVDTDGIIVFCSCGEKMCIPLDQPKIFCDNCGAESFTNSLESKYYNHEKKNIASWDEQVRRTKVFVKGKFDLKYGDILSLTSKLKLLPDKKELKNASHPSSSNSVLPQLLPSVSRRRK